MTRRDAYTEAKTRFGPRVVLEETAQVRPHPDGAFEIALCIIGREDGPTLRELGRGPSWELAIRNAQRSFDRGAS